MSRKFNMPNLDDDLDILDLDEEEVTYNEIDEEMIDEEDLDGSLWKKNRM